MKVMLLMVVASLCALALYPIVVSVGQRVAKRLRKVQDELNEHNAEEESEE
jgi:hypothetical protein